MQKFMMFEDIPENATIMYPDHSCHTKDEVKNDYPILATPLGMIGFTTDAAGTVGDFIFMGYFDSVNVFRDVYVKQGAEVTPEMSNAEACEVITEFVNNPPNDEEDALDTYLSM